ncbi:MAG: T9SS type A sorting domain-containing protein [Paludibacter sp.]
MRKLIHVFMFIFCFSLIAKADENKTSNDPWVSEIGLRYNMPIVAKVYKNNTSTLYQTPGLLLGVFKDNKCWGFIDNIDGPDGQKTHIVTVGYNTSTATGFTYKAYDPILNLEFNIAETVNFTAGSIVGQIDSPVSLHTVGAGITPNAIDEIADIFISVYPNPIDSHFSIKFGNEIANDSRIELFNLTGSLVKVLYVGVISPYQSLNFNTNVASGVYILKSTLGKKTNIKRLLFK